MKPLPIPSIFLHRVGVLGPNPLTGKKRAASNWPFYGIVYDGNTPSWTLEQEKIEFYWHTFWITALLGLLWASVWAALALGVLLYNPYTLARLELFSHLRDMRMWVHVNQPTSSRIAIRIASKALGMRGHYPYVRWCFSYKQIMGYFTRRLQ